MADNLAIHQPGRLSAAHKIKACFILPVNEGEEYCTDSIYSFNERQRMESVYEALGPAYMQVDFLPFMIASGLRFRRINSQSAHTTDGLHLSVAGYQALSKS